MKPILSFGIIADIQYADCDDALNWKQDKMRYYRNALVQFNTALDYWSSRRPSKPSFILQLGDFLDGRSRHKNKQRQALQSLLCAKNAYDFTFHHVWGNHEFYCFSRNELIRLPLNSAFFPKDIRSDCGYHYDFLATDGLRFVMLDTYEISILGYDKKSIQYQTAEKMISENNPNENWNDGFNMVGVQRRFRTFNGAVSSQQLEWLESCLEYSRKHKENVVVFSHMPLHPEAVHTPGTLCMNYDEVLSIINRYHDCVILYLAGHEHDGGLALDQYGIHHLTVNGVIESAPGVPCFGTVDVYHDKLRIIGEGPVPSLDVKLRHCLALCDKNML